LTEFETLYALAEVSVAIAGFAAIVVIFKRGDSGHWRASDADRFNGMLLHAVAAGFFCLLPSLLSVFTSSLTTVWTVASAALGLQILLHSAIIFWLPTSGLVARAVLLLALGAFVLQVLNVFGVYFSGAFGPYLAGILWHVTQASFLFVTLVWVRKSDTEAR